MSFFKRFRKPADEMSPPSPQEVVKRAYILNTVVVYGKMLAGSGVLPTQLRAMSAEDAKPIEEAMSKLSKQVAGVAHKIGFLQFLSPQEAYLIGTPFRELEDQMILDVTWRTESLQVIILWALKKIDALPDCGSLADDKVLKILRLEQFSECVASAQLRPTSELEKLRDRAELWHWRSRTRQLIEEKSPFPETSQFKSYDQVVRFSAKASEEGGLETIDEDFSIKGKAFRDLSEAEWHEAASIIEERHFALNWICGKAPNNHWDQTPTGT